MPSGARRSFKNDAQVAAELAAATLAGALSKVTAWLRLAASTPNAGEYDVIANVLVPSNPTNQVDADRKPAATTSANGLPTCTWDGSDVLPWPMVASNSSTAKWGLMVWVKPTANIAARQRIFHAFAGSNLERLTIDIVGGGLGANFYSTPGNGQGWEKANCLTANVWQCIRVQFDGSLSGVDNIIQFFVNEVKVTGATIGSQGSGVITSLNAPVGNNLLGAGPFDVDGPGAPLLSGSQTGPNWFVLNATPTAAQGLALMNFEVPT